MKKLSKDSVLNRILKNAGIILTGNSTASVFNLASFTIMANQLGPQYLGIFVLCQSYTLIINDIFNIQTWESMIKYGAPKLKEGRVESVISTNLLLDFISALLAIALALLLALPTAKLLGWGASLPTSESIVEYLCIYSITIVFNLTTFTIGIPRLFGKFLSVSIIFTVMAIIKLVGIAAAAWLSTDLKIYIQIYVFFEIITNIALITLSIRLVNERCGKGWWQRALDIDRDQIRFILWTNLRTIIRIPVRHLDVIVISTIIDMSTLGIYKVYKEFAGLINRVGEPVNQAIYPEFTRLIGANDSKKSVEITKKTMFFLSLVGIALFLSLYLSAELLIQQFFGEEYLALISALYLMLAFYSISFATVPINSLFIAAGFAKFSFFVLLFTNTIYLVSAFGLGTLYGIYGLIVAYAIQLALNKGLKIYLLEKHPEDWNSKIR